MAVIDPYAVAANALKMMVDQEFAPEQIVADHDELHESLGTDGPVVGIAPVRQAPMPGNRAAQNVFIQIQFFDFWEKEIDPTLSVDPRIITAFHTRLLEKIRSTTVQADNALWYFQWEGTEYPRDPVGNKTRFIMTLRSWADNGALVETRA
jgi:hypothetical protein